MCLLWPIRPVLPRPVPVVCGPTGWPVRPTECTPALHHRQAPKTQHIVVLHRVRPPHLGCGHGCASGPPAGLWTGGGSNVDSLWTESACCEPAACFAPSCVHCTAGARRYERVFYYTPPRLAGAGRGGAGHGARGGARAVAPGTRRHAPTTRQAPATIGATRHAPAGLRTRGTVDCLPVSDNRGIVVGGSGGRLSDERHA